MKLFCSALVLSLFVSACDYADYPYAQGSPKDYNTLENPKRPSVVYRTQTETFSVAEEGLDAENKQALATFLSGIGPLSTQSMELRYGTLSESQLAHVVRTLRAKGFKRSLMKFAADNTMPAGEVQLSLRFAEAEAPRCPDWTKSGSDYSNTNHTNMRCPQAVNLSRMVANPAHLERSDGLRVVPDAMNMSTAIDAYRQVKPAESNADSSNTESLINNEGATTSNGSGGQ